VKHVGELGVRADEDRLDLRLVPEVAEAAGEMVRGTTLRVRAWTPAPMGDEVPDLPLEVQGGREYRGVGAGTVAPVEAGRLTRGEVYAALGGALLLISLFVPWYSQTVGGGLEANVNAWQAFDAFDLLLALIGLIGVGQAVLRAAGAEPNEERAVARVVAGAALLAAAIALYRAIELPEVALDDTIELRIGPFVALIAATGMAYGAVTALGERTAGVSTAESDEE
jgi:hypothetical protein